MNKRAKSQRIFWCLLPSFTRYSLILLLAGVFLSSVAATRSTSVQIAQRSETTSTQATRAAAFRLFDEGLQLYKQGTAESLRQGIEKSKQALPLWRQDRFACGTIEIMGKFEFAKSLLLVCVHFTR